LALRSGRYTLGPESGSLVVRTGREGPAAPMGHDLTLLATRWAATVTIDAEEPRRSRVRATVDAGSLLVRDAAGGPVGLSDGQKAEIESNIRGKVLHSDRYPRITFRSTDVEGGALRATVTGDLVIRRRTRPVTLQLRVSRARAPGVVATTSIIQTDFGIEPYSALLGALRVKNIVEVTVEVRLPTG
jgi:polyisoprenoid-binding protein YceI